MKNYRASSFITLLRVEKFRTDSLLKLYAIASYAAIAPALITGPTGALTQLSSPGNPDHPGCVVRAGGLGCRDWGLLRA